MAVADLIVIGAGLSGCALVSRLRQQGWDGSISVVEAGRGPGGRTATRRRRDQTEWRLDHGAPGLHFTQPMLPGLESLLEPLRLRGILVRDAAPTVSIDAEGQLTANGAEAMPEGGWWRGLPCMAALSEQLLELGGLETFDQHWQCRVRWLQRSQETWTLANSDRSWQLSGRRIVFSGNLLAHPRSLAMLQWSDVPLRSAVAPGVDSALDQALDHLAHGQADVRWNLMLDLPVDGSALPRQIWLTAEAQQRWQVERLVLQPQTGGHTGLVVHGLHDGSSITPESQPKLLKQQEQRLNNVLNEILNGMPELQQACREATSLGVMRWGASRPTSHPLPHQLQWCPTTRVGFCGDYVEGPGFGRAQGALESGVLLADQLLSA